MSVFSFSAPMCVGHLYGAVNQKRLRNTDLGYTHSFCKKPIWKTLLQGWPDFFTHGPNLRKNCIAGCKNFFGLVFLKCG